MADGYSSTLTFNDLVIEVAYKLGIAYYGNNGDEQPQAPIDPHDLAICQQTVNKSIRMFIHDAPPNGWRWTRPVALVDLWGDTGIDPTNPIASVGVYDPDNDETPITLTLSTQVFFPSMELRAINIGTTPVTPDLNFAPGTVGKVYIINRYLGPNSVALQGNQTFASTSVNLVGQTWSITSTGDFTLPTIFGGQYTGNISFRQGTNRGVFPHWVDESQIRARRSNVTQETGTPYQFAVRIIGHDDYNASGSPRRRWELMAYRQPREHLQVLFPFILHFDYLVNTTDVQPAPFGHDETVKAACLAVAEKDVEKIMGGPDWLYYQHCLPNSYRVDGMSTPRALGYFGNPSAAASTYPPIREFRDQWYQRPSVAVNP